MLCAPEFLTKLGRLGPLLFEADHCKRSPIWQLGVLYGFFYFWAISFFVFLSKKKVLLNRADIFVLLMIILSSILIVIPEFIYMKDIYPAHYRANTMFKLVYQAFMMLSLSSSYIIIRLASQFRLQGKDLSRKAATILYSLTGITLICLVSIYPYFATMSYYEDLRSYRGLDGLKYLENLYPKDYGAILWMNKHIEGQPVIAEAQGDSYTDYGRVSANTGLPTVLGWTVHEWLWRGTYEVPSPRIAEVATVYESRDITAVSQILKKYNVSFVFVGNLEREKYKDATETVLKRLGKVMYENGETRIYKISQMIL